MNQFKIILRTGLALLVIGGPGCGMTPSPASQFTYNIAASQTSFEASICRSPAEMNAHCEADLVTGHCTEFQNKCSAIPISNLKPSCYKLWLQCLKALKGISIACPNALTDVAPSCSKVTLTRTGNQGKLRWQFSYSAQDIKKLKAQKDLTLEWQIKFFKERSKLVFTRSIVQNWDATLTNLPGASADTTCSDNDKEDTLAIVTFCQGELKPNQIYFIEFRFTLRSQPDWKTLSETAKSFVLELVPGRVCATTTIKNLLKAACKASDKHTDSAYSFNCNLQPSRLISICYGGGCLPNIFDPNSSHYPAYFTGTTHLPKTQGDLDFTNFCPHLKSTSTQTPPRPRPPTPCTSEFKVPWGSASYTVYNGRYFFFDKEHLGVDIALPEGAPVYAGVNGTLVVYRAAQGYGELVAVIEVDLGRSRAFTNGYGNTVRAQKVLWILGHLRKSKTRGGVPLRWRVGARVSAGDIIGYINDYAHNGHGREHVHIGLRLQSQAEASRTDPSAWFRGYEGRTDFAKFYADPMAVIRCIPPVTPLPPGCSGPCCGKPQTGWYCDGANRRVYCSGDAAARTESCPHGCLTKPQGQHDVCRQQNGCSGPCCEKPQTGWYCDGVSRRVHCSGGRITKTENCPHGCLTKPQGQHDVCKPAPCSGPCCGKPQTGWYCDSTSRRVYCSGGHVTKTEGCPHGCLSKPQGQHDVCKPAPCNGFCCGKALSGYYCDDYKIVYCNNQRETSRIHCHHGCRRNPPGQHDSCFPREGREIRNVNGKCIDISGGTNANETNIQLYDCNKTNAQRWHVVNNQIINAGGRCLDLAGNNSANGTNIQLYQCNWTSAQRWYFHRDGTIRNANGKCLDMSGNNSANGTNIQIYQCNKTNAQKWSLK